MTLQIRIICVLGWVFCASVAQGGIVALPLVHQGEVLRHEVQSFDSLQIPTAAAVADNVPSRWVEGQVARRSWRLDAPLASREVFAMVRKVLQDAGFEAEFTCETDRCGGFEFRYGIETLAIPDMIVNLSDFDFLSASRAQDEAAATLLVSRSGDATYVQLFEVYSTPVAADVPETLPHAEETLDVAQAPASASLREQLLQAGTAVLSGIEFASGAADIVQASVAGLDALAEMLHHDPQMEVLLVGHTDNRGALAQNIDLSQRRAEDVRDYITTVHDIPNSRIQIAGAGFMAPRHPNDTPAGQEANRRVEVVLIRR